MCPEMGACVFEPGNGPLKRRKFKNCGNSGNPLSVANVPLPAFSAFSVGFM